MRRPLVLPALLCLLAVAALEPRAAGRPAARLLDDTEWTSRYRRLRGWLPVWKGDVLSFEGGRFQSREAQTYGFSPAPYRVRRAFGVWVWTARQRNADGEVLHWRGARVGGRMTGAFSWERPDGTRRRFRFSALSERAAPARGRRRGRA